MSLIITREEELMDRLEQMRVERDEAREWARLMRSGYDPPWARYCEEFDALPWAGEPRGD